MSDWGFGRALSKLSWLRGWYLPQAGKLSLLRSILTETAVTKERIREKEIVSSVLLA